MVPTICVVLDCLTGLGLLDISHYRCLPVRKDRQQDTTGGARTMNQVRTNEVFVINALEFKEKLGIKTQFSIKDIRWHNGSVFVDTECDERCLEWRNRKNC